MKRSAAAVALAILLAPIVAQGQAEPALWRFVYPDAKALISIDWARIRQSQAGAMLREKWLAPGAMPAIPGLELLEQIDRILISSPGNKSPDDATQPPVLIAIHGHFDAAKTRALFARFGAKAQAYNSFQVYRPQGKQAKDMAWVLLDGETILFGDAPSVFGALDRKQFSSAAIPLPPAPGSMMARAAEMEAGYDFWVIMEATEIMANEQIAALFHGGEWASEARGFEAGINLRSGLAADVTVRFSSDAAAKQIGTELTHLLSAVGKDKSQGVQVQELAKRLKFVVDGPAAKISLRLTQAELEKSAQAFAESRKASARRTGTTTAAPALPPAKPGVIRIEGLDEGTRELPYQQPTTEPHN